MADTTPTARLCGLTAIYEAAKLDEDAKLAKATGDHLMYSLLHMRANILRADALSSDPENARVMWKLLYG